MCVQCVAKPSLVPAVLTVIEIFIEENSQTVLLPRLLLQEPSNRNVELFEIICISYIYSRLEVFFFFWLNNNKNTVDTLYLFFVSCTWSFIKQCKQ